MRYRILLLASVLLAATLAITGTANAKQREMQRKRISGVVESVHGQRAFIRTDHGSRVPVQLGPQSYWQQRGYRLRSGSRVTVDGWYENGSSDWYFAGSIAGPGFYFALSNDDGIPYWVNDDDRYYGAGWGPCGETYDVWYGCHPYPARFYAPPPPPHYYVWWGPSWRDRHPYRHWNNGWHRGWDKRNDRGRDHDRGEYRDRDRDDDRGDYRDRDRDRRDQPPPQQPPRDRDYRGGPRGRR